MIQIMIICGISIHVVQQYPMDRPKLATSAKSSKTLAERELPFLGGQSSARGFEL
jgi:hypothetical protein